GRVLDFVITRPQGLDQSGDGFAAELARTGLPLGRVAGWTGRHGVLAEPVEHFPGRCAHVLSHIRLATCPCRKGRRFPMTSSTAPDRMGSRVKSPWMSGPAFLISCSRLNGATRELTLIAPGTSPSPPMLMTTIEAGG